MKSPQPIGTDADFIALQDRPSKRFSQQVACNCISALEAAVVGALTFLVLLPHNQFLHPDFRLAISSGVAVAAIVLSCAVWSGAASYDRFFSRLALLPGALASGLFATGVALISGAGLAYAMFCLVGMFCAVYLAKIMGLLLRRQLEKAGRLTRLVAVAAQEGEQRKALVEALGKRSDILIVFSGSPASIGTLAALARDDKLDEIVLAGHAVAEENIAALAGLAVTLVRVTPQDSLDIHVMGPWDAPAAVISYPPLRNWGGVIKRLLDIAGSLTAIFLLSPVLLFCALAIKLESPGPVFFVQERAGYRNKPFRMFKFRSMYIADSDLTGSKLTQREDPRVTKSGKWLRKSSADELPQLFNVLLGDMSLVGPRPHPKGAKAGSVLYDTLIPCFYARYRMKPGITGLAQVSGHRGNTETEQHLYDRFRSDIQYSNDWNPVIDVIILFRTVLHLCKATNAF